MASRSSFSSFSAWGDAFDSYQESARGAVIDATNHLGEQARDAIRSRIPPSASTSVGMPYPFPGYAATGVLRESIISTDANDSPPETPTVAVGLSPSAGRLEQIKAHVHEFGAVIYPKNAKALRFEIKGEVIYAKRVQIKEKMFFRSGWVEFAQNAPEIMSRFLAEHWPGA